MKKGLNADDACQTRQVKQLKSACRDAFWHGFASELVLALTRLSPLLDVHATLVFQEVRKFCQQTVTFLTIRYNNTNTGTKGTEKSNQHKLTHVTHSSYPASSSAKSPKCGLHSPPPEQVHPAKPKSAQTNQEIPTRCAAKNTLQSSGNHTCEKASPGIPRVFNASSSSTDMHSQQTHKRSRPSQKH